MIKPLRQHIIPLIAITALPLLVLTVVFFWQRSYPDVDRKLASEAEAYKEQPLPQVPLIELKSSDDYFEKVKDKDALLIYLMNGCDACEKELRVIAESASDINPEVKIYGVMFQDQETAEQYLQKHIINFPILLDKDGKLFKKLRIKYFPTNLKIKNGVIKEAWFGVARDKEDFLKRVNLYQK
jgi:peroxiredoxin